MIKFTIVTGIAGSGKSTYVEKHRHKYDRVLLHDEFVAQRLFSSSMKHKLREFFPEAESDNDITKENIKKWIFESPALNKIYSNYWKNMFVMFLIRITKYAKHDTNILVECPFIDDNIAALKELFPATEIIWINANKDLITRLKDRNWSDVRINETISAQNEDLRNWQYIFSERIDN